MYVYLLSRNKLRGAFDIIKSVIKALELTLCRGPLMVLLIKELIEKEHLIST
jgi:hypothetical protein